MTFQEQRVETLPPHVHPTGTPYYRGVSAVSVEHTLLPDYRINAHHILHMSFKKWLTAVLCFTFYLLIPIGFSPQTHIFLAFNTC